MRPNIYTLVPQDASDVDEKEFPGPIARPPLSFQLKCLLFALCAALLASVTANTYFAYRQLFKPWELYDELPSKYCTLSTCYSFLLAVLFLLFVNTALTLLHLAHLRRNIPTEILANDDYDSLNRTVQDAAWNDRDIEPWNGFLALDEDYAIAQGLPHSQRWPWDLSKGVYVLTSAHELHCVVSRNESCSIHPPPSGSFRPPIIIPCSALLL